MSSHGVQSLSEKAPVLLITFNRPHLTTQVFNAIRMAKPERLYIASDGPRPNRLDDVELIDRVRNIVSEVDWPCHVQTRFLDKNLGCKNAVCGAIDWFFENEESGIILEDDCLPHPDFFYFCSEMLDFYKHDHRIWVVTGDNFQNGRKYGSSSHYFSHYNHVWGWATWRRAWAARDMDIVFWPSWKTTEAWKMLFTDRIERKYWETIFDRTFLKKMESAWDYPWTATVWYHRGLTVTPNVNLIQNIGFGEHATHTKASDNPLSRLRTAPIGDISYPDIIERNKAADKEAFDFVFGGKNLRFPYKLTKLPRKLLSFSYRAFKAVLFHGRFDKSRDP
jgi:hypothetical protein